MQIILVIQNIISHKVIVLNLVKMAVANNEACVQLQFMSANSKNTIFLPFFEPSSHDLKSVSFCENTVADEPMTEHFIK